MPRPMLRTPQQTQLKAGEYLCTASDLGQRLQINQTNKMKMDRMLRKARSKTYMEALHKLDAGGHVHNHRKVQEIIETIREEFPEVEISGILLGYVAICYLGEPYEVHTLDMSGEIIEHYKAGQMLPNGLEKARTLAIRGGYEFIEVYVDCCRAVSASGAVSVLPC